MAPQPTIPTLTRSPIASLNLSWTPPGVGEYRGCGRRSRDLGADFLPRRASTVRASSPTSARDLALETDMRLLLTLFAALLYSLTLLPATAATGHLTVTTGTVTQVAVASNTINVNTRLG